MKVKEYWRLAKISLKARKKETRSTIRGMSFSLIIIVPLLFALIGINQGMLKKLNAHPEELYATLYSMSEETKVDPGSTWGVSSIGYNIRLGSYGNDIGNHEKFMDQRKDKYIKYSFHSKSYQNNFGGENSSYYERAFVNGAKHKVTATNDLSSTSLCVVDEDQLNMLNTVLKPQSIKLNGFKGDGKRQVIVNEGYLKAAGLNADDVIGQKFSVYFQDQSFSGDSTMFIDEFGVIQRVDKMSHYLFKDFEVVGVLNNKNKNVAQLKGATFIVSSSSYYKNGVAVLAPVRKPINTGSGVVEGYYFGDYKETDKLTSDYVFPGANYYSDKVTINNMDNHQIDNSNKKYTEVLGYYLQGSEFSSFDKELSQVFPEFKNDYSYSQEMQFKSLVGSEVYGNFSMIASIVNMAMLVAGIFGGVILFAALVNLFNSVKHSVDSRRNYLGVMKAIGARNSTIPKMYFFEIVRIFAKVYLRVLIIGSAICFGILVGIYYMGKYTPLQLSIGWELIPIVMAMLGVLLVVVGLIYSLICTLKLSKEPITEMLEG